MSELRHERDFLDQALGELEQRVYSRIGRWAVAILSTCVAISIGAATQWFGLTGRVTMLEVWKTERAKPIEAYYQDEKTTAARLAAIETNVAFLVEAVKELKEANKK